jgi:hypothetical protein
LQTNLDQKRTAIDSSDSRHETRRDRRTLAAGSMKTIKKHAGAIGL